MTLLVVAFVIVALVFGGYTLIRSDAFARIAGQQFRAVQPVYAISTSRTTREIHGETILPFPVSRKIEQDLVVVRSVGSQTIGLSIAAAKISVYPWSTAPSPDLSALLYADRVVVRSEGVTQELSVSDAPTILADYIGLVGKRIIEIPFDGHGMAPAVSCVSDTKLARRSLNVLNIATFIEAPFATNVDWWDCRKNLILGDVDQLEGDIRYEKIQAAREHIEVSVKGKLAAMSVRVPNGLTLGEVRADVSGQYFYSTALKGWESGNLTIELSTVIAEDRDRERVVLKWKVSFSSRPHAGDASDLLKMGDFLPSDRMQALQDLSRGNSQAAGGR